MSNANFLVVEDDVRMRRAITQILKKLNYDVTAVADGESALAQIDKADYDMAIIDLKLPGIDGLEVLRAIKEREKPVSVIIITAYATVDSAVQAMKEGAEDYIPKPFNLEEIRIVVKKVMEKRDLFLKTRYLQGELRRQYKFGNIIGASPQIREVLEMVVKVAPSRTTILIFGETGTGKELVARAIHFNSLRADNVFLPVNCGALSENLLESELFGHVKGAFTGAVSDKRGLFEVADGGTVFLDEVGDVSLGLQQKLLRVLEHGEIQPVGSTRRAAVDVRVIAATNKNLEDMVKRNQFREDLFYRLSVVPIHLPPLRKRREDVQLLASSFLAEFCEENHKEISSIAADAMAALTGHDWPGNVRELRNVIERAVLLETSGALSRDCLPVHLTSDKRPVGAHSAEDLRTLEEVSKHHILEVLEQTGGNKTRAAEILGINRTSLWRMIQRLQIETE
jgi:DNA-binding NtrC family response regulator